MGNVGMKIENPFRVKGFSGMKLGQNSSIFLIPLDDGHLAVAVT
jgi:hypothetical protein